MSDHLTGKVNTFKRDEYVEYPGTIVGIEKNPSEWAKGVGLKPGPFGDSLIWRILLDDDAGKGGGRDGADREEWHFTGVNMTNKNKLGRTYKWLTGKSEVSPDESYDLRPYAEGDYRVGVYFAPKDDDPNEQVIFRLKSLDE